MRFSEDFIEKVKDANNIIDLISQHTQLRPMAGGYMGRCPFPDHQERTASFSVSETRQLYNCFGCHKSGSIFTFIQDFMGLSFPEAVEFLASRANISMPEDPGPGAAQQDQVTRKKKAIIQINKLALQYFTESFRQLSKDHPVRIYAEQKRGLTAQTISDFQIGYAPKEWDGFARYAESKGANLSVAEEARLIKRRQPGDSYGDGYLDIFRDRLMFPILNQMNEPVAFGGRIISQGEPKYLNSGETLVFNKGKILYGLSQTAKFVRADDQVLVVEGYMDLVSLYQSGIHNAVAPMGTALTPDQSRILSRLTKNVIILFDGDEAGQRAAERSLPILLGADVHPKGLILPDGMDPDDFVKSQGAEALTQLISTSPDLFSMVLGMWLRGYRGEASDKVKMSNLLQPVFAMMQDQRLKRLYLQEAAEKLKVEENWLRDALRGTSSKSGSYGVNNSRITLAPAINTPQQPQPDKNYTVKSTENSVEIVSLKGATKIEATLLGIVLKNTCNFEYFQKMSGMEYLMHPGVREVLAKAANAYRQGPDKFDKLAGLLTSFVDCPELLFSETFALGPEVAEKKQKETSEKPENEVAKGLDNDFAIDIAKENQKEKQQETEKKLLGDCLKRLRDQFLKAQADQLTAEIKVQSTPEKLEKLMSIQRDRLAINKEP